MRDRQEACLKSWLSKYQEAEWAFVSLCPCCARLIQMSYAHVYLVDAATPAKTTSQKEVHLTFQTCLDLTHEDLTLRLLMPTRMR